MSRKSETFCTLRAALTNHGDTLPEYCTTLIDIRDVFALANDTDTYALFLDALACRVAEDAKEDKYQYLAEVADLHGVDLDDLSDNDLESLYQVVDDDSWALSYVTSIRECGDMVVCADVNLNRYKDVYPGKGSLAKFLERSGAEIDTLRSDMPSRDAVPEMMVFKINAKDVFRWQESNHDKDTTMPRVVIANKPLIEMSDGSHVFTTNSVVLDEL